VRVSLRSKDARKTVDSVVASPEKGIVDATCLFCVDFHFDYDRIFVALSLHKLCQVSLFLLFTSETPPPAISANNYYPSSSPPSPLNKGNNLQPLLSLFTYFITPSL
jgi:hypothetical protein